MALGRRRHSFERVDLLWLVRWRSRWNAGIERIRVARKMAVHPKRQSGPAFIMLASAVPNHRYSVAVPRDVVHAEPVPGVVREQRGTRNRRLSGQNSNQIVDH